MDSFMGGRIDDGRKTQCSILFCYHVRILIQMLKGKEVTLPGIDGKLKIQQVTKMKTVIMNMVDHPQKIDLLELCSNAHPSEVHIGQIHLSSAMPASYVRWRVPVRAIADCDMHLL